MRISYSFLRLWNQLTAQFRGTGRNTLVLYACPIAKVGFYYKQQTSYRNVDAGMVLVFSLKGQLLR